MRKIQKEQENPFDNILYELSDYVSEPLNNLGITPNMVTIFSVFTSGLSFYFLGKQYYKIGCFFILFSYFLDCLDGHLARKYKRVTKLGDYLDHISDGIFGLGLIYQLIQLPNYEIKLLILTIFSILMTIHLGCQENIYDKNDSPSLSFTKFLAPKDPKCIKYTRYFGCGTTILVICLLFLI